MSFTRYTLASLRIAFTPKLGTTYRYAINGPFRLGPRMTPIALKSGFVLYEVRTESGHSYDAACPIGVFASMCREA